MTAPSIKYWSYSSLTTFEACPYRFYLDRVDKQPRGELPENHPISRGIAVHKGLEEYIKGNEPSPPGEARRYEALVNELRTAYDAGKVQVESSWWFDENWGPAEPWRGWLVVKTDVAYRVSETEMQIIDWKTGKSINKDIKHGGQMQLYAAAAFMANPQLEVVSIKLPYLDEAPPEKSKRYLRPNIEPFIRSFSRRATAMFTAASAGAFVPKPNRANCKYCDFGSANGTGVCAYGIAE